MSSLPRVIEKSRGPKIALLAGLALCQAGVAGVAAFSTRDVFVAMRGEPESIPVLSLVLIAVAGLGVAGLRFVERVTAEWVGQHYASSLRIALFTHLTQVSARNVAKRRTGALAMRFVGDLTAVRGWVSTGVSRLISSSIVLPLATLVLFLIDPLLGLAAAVPVIAGLGAMALVGPKLGPAHQKLRARRAKLAADMTERIPHAPELRLLGRLGTETQHLKNRTSQLIDSALERARGAAFLRVVPDAVSGLAAAGILAAAVTGGATGADAAGALAALALMVQPMRDLAGVWDKHRAWLAARDKCQALFDLPMLEPDPVPDSAPAVEGPQEIRFEDISAGPLNAVSITAGRGRRIALIGGNGAGKSTLLMIAAGLDDPAAGRVYVGDRTVASLSAQERRRVIALVGTRSPILAGSIRRALTMGNQSRPSDETILEAASAFGLSGVIERLGGLDGKVAEAGRNLSAGEGRRVLLTRAYLSGATTLLLDEPDDALDQDGPDLVHTLTGATGATTLIITHNLSLAAQMDELWYFEDGKIVEAGAPADLLARTGPTARFFAVRSAA